MKKLTEREQQKYITIKEYSVGRISRKQAAVRLGVRVETVSRLTARYRQYGKGAFVHKNHSNHHAPRVNEAIENEIVALYNSTFDGFNFTHFYETVQDERRISKQVLPSSRTVYAILKRHGITSPVAHKATRPPNPHPVRPRRQGFGELVQLDASFHDWLSLGPEHKITLHAGIDDATSTLTAGWFETYETLHGYCQLTKQILEEYGIPRIFYTDRRTVFAYLSKHHKETVRTQFQAICSQLGIEIIATSSPQAKGRIERSFRTMQDRLLHEMKRQQISSIEQANQFLPGYIERHNERFALNPSSCVHSFGALDATTASQLDRILSTAEERSILTGNIVSYKGRQYLPVKDDGELLSLAVDTKVVIVSTLANELLLKHKENYYKLIWTANGRFTAHTPKPTHPWKQWHDNERPEQ